MARNDDGSDGQGASTPRSEPSAHAASPSSGGRLSRLLPRIALLGFAVAVMVVFRGVLLPFGLAIFVAFLLYPLVSLLERGRIGSGEPPRFMPARVWSTLPSIRWHLPRWLGVMLIYTLLFGVAYLTVPRMVVSLASQLAQLKDTVPRTFATLNDWERQGQEKLADLLEVERLSPTSRETLNRALRELQAGTLAQRPLGRADLTPDLAAAEGANGAEDDDSGGGGFSLFHIEIHVDGERRSAKVPTDSTDADGPVEPLDVPTPLPTGEDDESTSGASDGEPDGVTNRDASTDVDEEDESGTPPSEASVDPSAEPEVATLDEDDDEEEGPRFGEAERTLAYRELLEAIDDELAKDGLADPDLPERAGELALRLGQARLGLPRTDPGLEMFQGLVINQVRGVLRREEYSDVVRAETASAMASARVWAMERIRGATSGVTTLVEGVFDFFLVLMLTAFFLIFFPSILDYVRDLVPPHYHADYATILQRINTRLSGAIRGQLIICVVNGFLTYPGVYYCGQLFDAPVLSDFALLLSLVATVLSLIPIFGVILSTIPMVLLAITQSIWAGVAVIVWVCVIHAVEAYILNPHILGHTAKMNPILVVFALLAGKHVGGLIGALLAVPIASVTIALFGFYRRRMAEIYAAEANQPPPEDTWDD